MVTTLPYLQTEHRSVELNGRSRCVCHQERFHPRKRALTPIVLQPPIRTLNRMAGRHELIYPYVFCRLLCSDDQALTQLSKRWSIFQAQKKPLI